jgi:hypothetical protein
MKKEVGVLVIFLFVLLSLVVSVLAAEGQRGTGFADQGGNVQAGIQAQEEITNNLENSIATGAILDLNDPLYKNNKDIVRKVLREKYNVDITNIIGARVQAGKLLLPGGTSINMQTGKRITLDASGSQVRTLTDGTTTVVNAQGVDYDGINLKVRQGNKVTYQGAESQNVQNFAGSTERITIINADLITTNGNTIKNAKSVQIRNVDNNLAFLSFVCQGTDQSTINTIHINCQPNKRVEADIFDYGASLTLQQGMTFSHKNLNGTVDKDTAKLIMRMITPNTEEFTTTHTTITFEHNGTKEVILAKTETKFKLDDDEGVYELHLGASSRFSHQQPEELRSFFILNPGPATYSLFIRKPSHFMDKEAALALFNGFADPNSQLFLLKNSIHFGVYHALLPYNIFESTDKNNFAQLDGTNLRLDNTEPCTTNDVFFSLHTSDFNVLEACTTNTPVRYADFEYEDTPLRVQTFTTSYNLAEITFTNNVLQQSKSENYFLMYPESKISPFMEKIQNYEKTFVQCNRLESFDQQTLLEVFQ